jgi:hypothetical protein
MERCCGEPVLVVLLLSQSPKIHWFKRKLITVAGPKTEPGRA